MSQEGKEEGEACSTRELCSISLKGQLLPFWLCPQVNQLLGFPLVPPEGFPHGSELEATDSGE